MTERDALVTKNYIWALQKINFYDRNFFVRNWVEKIALKLGNRTCLKCRIWLSIMRWSLKTICEPFKKLLFKIEIFSSEIGVKKIFLKFGK